MSLREILHLTKQPFESHMTQFAAQTIKVLVSLLLQLGQLCEDQDVELSKKIHAFDLRSNEWAIAALQIYENLFRKEAEDRNERGEIQFDSEGEVISDPKNNLKEPVQTLSASLRPLLEFIDGYRRRVAAPTSSIVNKKYTRYADLSYISKRMKMVEDQTHEEIYRGNQLVSLDYVPGNDYSSVGGATFVGQHRPVGGAGGGTGVKQGSIISQGKTSGLPNLSASDYDEQRMHTVGDLNSTRKNKMSKTLDAAWGLKQQQQSEQGGLTQQNIVNTTNVVTVDFIEAEYEQHDQDGFKKRMPQGYNGTKARLRTQNGTFGRGFVGNNDGGVGDGNHIGIGLIGPDAAGGPLSRRNLATAGAPPNKGGPMSDLQVREVLDNPNASKFLDTIIANDDVPEGSKFQTGRVGPSQTQDGFNQKSKLIRVRHLKKKGGQNTTTTTAAEGYKWPYHDSYVPGLGMNNKDKRVVRKGIQKQYFPNEHCTFNPKDLKQRQNGIKTIEEQYVERIQTAGVTRFRGGNQGTGPTKVKESFLLKTTSFLSPDNRQARAGIVGSMRSALYASTDRQLGLSNNWKTGSGKINMTTKGGTTIGSRTNLFDVTGPAENNRSISPFRTPVHKHHSQYRRITPLETMLDKRSAAEAAELQAQEPKLKFPLVQGDDILDNLLSELVGADKAKSILFKSQLGEIDQNSVIDIRDDGVVDEEDCDVTIRDRSAIDTQSREAVSEKAAVAEYATHTPMKHQKSRKFNKSKTAKKRGGNREPQSTGVHQSLDISGLQSTCETTKLLINESNQPPSSYTPLDQIAEGESQQRQQRSYRKLRNIEDVERYCRPQNLFMYNPVDSGIKYSVIGLFGMPQEEKTSENPCMYTVLASVFPPGDAFKQKPSQSMFGANFFAEVDFARSTSTSQFFKQQDELDVEVAGMLIKLTENSVMVYDVKRIDLKTGKMSDYGFALQPLIHQLKQRNYVIGGRYQMPIYAGSIPEELRNAVNHPTTSGANSARDKPKAIFKRLVESGRIKTLDHMQIVTQIADLNPPEDETEVPKAQTPSMLHHLDKRDLEKYLLEDIFREYGEGCRIEDDGQTPIEQEFAPQLAKAGIYRTETDVIRAAKTAFKTTYML